MTDTEELNEQLKVLTERVNEIEKRLSMPVMDGMPVWISLDKTKQIGKFNPPVELL